MKMKAVCEQTGLTDRAVRFYIDEGLLSPACSENYLGRKTYDFQQQDVDTLNQIVVLRKFGFSVAQIKAVSQNPDSCRFLIEELWRQKYEIVNQEQQLLSALEQVRLDQSATLPELAQALRTAAQSQQVKEDGKLYTDTNYVRLFFKMLLICGSVFCGLLLSLLLIDIFAFYFESGMLRLSLDGFLAMGRRIGKYIPCFGVAIILFALLERNIRILWCYCRNDRKEEISVQAVVVDKRVNADAVTLNSFYDRTGGMIGSLVFRTIEGQLLELTVARDRYYLTQIGTGGLLVYQGTKLVKFTPEKNTRNRDRGL